MHRRQGGKNRRTAAAPAAHNHVDTACDNFRVVLECALPPAECFYFFLRRRSGGGKATWAAVRRTARRPPDITGCWPLLPTPAEERSEEAKGEEASCIREFTVTGVEGTHAEFAFFRHTREQGGGRVLFGRERSGV